MGRRLIGLALMVLAIGCGPEAVTPEASATGPDASKSAPEGQGRATSPRRGQINPNAQMPEAGSRANR